MPGRRRARGTWRRCSRRLRASSRMGPAAGKGAIFDRKAAPPYPPPRYTEMLSVRRHVGQMLQNLLELRSSNWGRVQGAAAACEATPENDPNYFMVSARLAMQESRKNTPFMKFLHACTQCIPNLEWPFIIRLQCISQPVYIRETVRRPCHPHLQKPIHP